MAEYSVKVLGGGRIQLSYVEVVAALDAAGWPAGEWATAAAVISQESDRVCNIYNTYKSGHYGLMQMSASAHPQWFKSLPNPNAWVDPVTNCRGGLTLWGESHYQPWEGYTNGRYTAFLLQATAAVTAYKREKRAAGNPSGTAMAQQIFRASVVQAIGDVQMNAAVQGVTDAIAGAGGSTGETISQAGGAVADAAGQQAGGILGISQLILGGAKWLGDAQNWVRIAQVVAGGALVIAGAAIMARPAVLAGGKAAGQVAAAVAPVKKAAEKAAGAVKKKTAAGKTTAPAKKTAAKKAAGGSKS